MLGQDNQQLAEALRIARGPQAVIALGLESGHLGSILGVPKAQGLLFPPNHMPISPVHAQARSSATQEKALAE